MSKYDLERELRRITLMIALLADAAEKYNNTIKTMEFNSGVWPQSAKGGEDLVHLRRKKKYLEFLLEKEVT